jgi:5,6-dimethylbenzimidazole synthase
MTGPAPDEAPAFADAFRADLARLFAWRRDVRRFRPAPVSEDLVDGLIDLAHLSPSVGNSQPWRWVRVESAAARARVRASFLRCNAEALASYAGERAACYAALKLEGLDAAPVQFAVFCDHAVREGHRLGRLTMPETLDYSVVTAISSFWLAARAHGLGVGWVSILEPEAIRDALDCPAAWRLVAYLCVGWPVEEHRDPELARHGWQARTEAGRLVLRR